MPPPPPPSKSYLLQISDSDLDSQSEKETNDLSLVSASQTRAPSASLRVQGDDNDADEEESMDGSHTEVPSSRTTESPSGKSKKKRKKRKKKKKKSNETSGMDTPKNVTFGDIRIRSFARSFYSDGVPSDGGWPLGFSNEEPFQDAEAPISVEDYEIDKQARLEERWFRICPDGAALPQTPLETRQWDFKFGTKNPLFRALTEKARMHAIMGIEEAPPSPPKKPASPPTGRRTRSNSDLGSRSTRQSSGRQRSGSYSTTRSSSYSEDKDVDFEARHVMQELEQLRTLRSKRGAKGCTCRKLQVYIPPPGSGKKAAHRRMKVPKLKEELRARNALPSPEGSREDMEKLLLDLVQKEPCCGPNCECVQNGIECQSETCTCWHAAAHHVKDGTKPLRPRQIEERCGNQFGMVTVDSDMIDAYRAPFLTCLPVETSSTSSSKESQHDDDTANEEKKMEVGA